jgi:hypothetical protein
VMHKAPSLWSSPLRIIVSYRFACSLF